MKHLTFTKPSRSIATGAPDNLDDVIERFFGFSEFRETVASEQALSLIGYELNESDNSYEISVDVPGINKEDIKIEVDGNKLLISGERKQESSEKAKTHKTWSRSYGKFTQAFTLPESVDADSIKATHEKGVLNITLPKSEPVQKKTIAIS